MIARHRGELRAHTRWRPSAPADRQPEPTGPDETDEAQAEESQTGEAQPQTRRRTPRLLLAVATVIGLAVIAGQPHAGRAPAAPSLPSTPQQWVEQWTAASLDNPARVCSQLFAPALAGAFKADTGRTCSSYYSSVKSASLRIRHILQAAGTAAVEAQQVGAARKWGYFTMVLSRVHGGWQAVDIVPGESIRPR